MGEPADQVEHLLRVLELIEEALEGDGSTAYMPDVTPAQAARYVVSALNFNGFVISKKAWS